MSVATCQVREMAAFAMAASSLAAHVLPPAHLMGHFKVIAILHNELFLRQ